MYPDILPADLDKHNELLKMFEFSVLIFDRYSYATELLIYLVKY